MRLLVCALLVGIPLISASVVHRHRRAPDDPVLHDWLTAEQKADLEPLKGDTDKFKEKVLEYYNQLPTDTRKEWDAKYRSSCYEWVKKVTTEEEFQSLLELDKTDVKAAVAKRAEYLPKLSEEDQKLVQAWEGECDKLLNNRNRRSISAEFQDFVSWMTPEQQQQIDKMKTEGLTVEQIREKSSDFFDALPADKQKELREKFKGTCKTFFTTLATPEELEAIKVAHESGNKAEVKQKVSEIVNRQTGESKETAQKMETVCTDVYAKEKSKRDVHDSLEKHLKWLSEDQKKTVEMMVTNGKSKQEIREFLYKLINESTEESTKKETQKICYAWLDEVATKEEVAALHKMHETDHDGCKKKVREYLQRVPEEKRKKIEANLPFCEKVWYGDHDHHGHHGHHRLRRHIDAVEEYLDWLSPEQKAAIKKLEDEGADFENVIMAKVKQFFKGHDSEKQEELKGKFKASCGKWVTDVATPEELEQLKKWRENGDHHELKQKLRELENKLPEEKKHTVEHIRDTCLAVWEVKGAVRIRRDHDSHTLDEAFTKYLTWTNEDQRKELKSVENNRAELVQKIFSLFEASEGETKKKAAEELKAACKHYAKDLFGEAGVASIKTLLEAGSTHDQITAKVQELVDAITDADNKAKAQRLADGCAKVYAAFPKRRRRAEVTEEDINKFLSWLTEEQQSALQVLKDNKDAFYKKIMEFYGSAVGEVKTKATEALKGACKHFGAHIFGPDHIKTIENLKESGASQEEIGKKVLEIVAGMTDAEQKAKAQKLVDGCKPVYEAAARRRRDHHVEDDSKYLTWLTEEQQTAVNALKEDKSAFWKQVMEYFKSATGDAKKTATEQLKGACKHYASHFFGEEKLNEIKTLKESGATHEAIATKIQGFVSELTDETEKSKAQKLVDGCKVVFEAAARRRRDHHDHSDAFVKYLSWVSDADKEELKKLKESAGNDKEAMYKKIMELFAATTGDTRKTATEQLKAACKHFSVDVFGEDKVNELKTMKESGAPQEDFEKKIQSFIAELTDDDKKKQGQQLFDGCKVIYAASARLRRAGVTEEDINKFLSWLTEEQQTALKAIKDDKDAFYKKIMEFYGSAVGEVKTKATEALKGACKHFGAHIFGPDHMKTIETLKESGASQEEIGKKVREIVAEMTDAEQKAKAQKLIDGCKPVYEASARRRRDHHHTLEHAFEKYLTWLDDAQKKELVSLKESSGENKEAVYKKILEFFDATEGETKKKAAEQLKGACKHYAKDLFGEDKVSEIKTLKESGDTHEAIGAKIQGFVDELTDDVKKTKAQKLVDGCRKIYAAATRRRRDHHVKEEDINKFLSWLTDEQRSAVTAVKEDREAFYKKIMEYFAAAQGEVKLKATESLKGACKHFGTHLLGEDKANEIKVLKESGASQADIIKKVHEIVAGITDEDKKKRAEKLIEGCKPIYEAASRRRRDHHVEDDSKYLTWLTEEQQTAVNALKEDKSAFWKQVMEYFKSATGDAKKTATEQLKGACKHYASHFFGEEKLNEIKTLKESGATHEVIRNKIQGFVSELTDETEKAKAQKLVDGCKVVFEAAARRRRAEVTEEDINKFLSWLTEEQQTALKAIKDNKDAFYKKIMEFYGSAVGEVKTKATEALKGACKHFGAHIFGPDHIKTIETLKESGASQEEIGKKVLEIVAGMTDAEQKAKAQKLVDGCKPVYEAAARRRRDHHHDHEQDFNKYLSWLSDDQKMELKSIKEASEDREEFYKKIMEYFKGTEGETKKKAAEDLKGACKHFGMALFGEDKINEVKTLKESGATQEVIGAKVQSFVDEMTDEVKKAKAQKLVDGCAQVYKVTRKRRNVLVHQVRRYINGQLGDSEDSFEELKDLLSSMDHLPWPTRMVNEAQLKQLCYKYARKIYGEENLKYLRRQYVDGADRSEMKELIYDMAAHAKTEDNLGQAERFTRACDLILRQEDRSRRSLTEVNNKLLMANKVWLTSQQQQQVNKTNVAGKLLEMYRLLEDKQRATLRLTASCKMVMEDGGVDKEKLEELYRKKLEGARGEVLAKMVGVLMGKEDQEVKELCMEAFKNAELMTAG